MHRHQTIIKWLIISLSILLAACSASKPIIGDDRVEQNTTHNLSTSTNKQKYIGFTYELVDNN